MAVYIDYVIYNPETGEIDDIIDRIRRKHNEKYGCNYEYELDVRADVEFVDKLNNKIKNVTINKYYVLRRARKREIASKSRYKVNKVNKIIITIVSEIQKNVIDTYLKLHVPMLWRHFLKNIANNRDLEYNFSNRPLYNFDRYCPEWYLYNLIKNNTDGGDIEDIRMLDDEIIIMLSIFNYSMFSLRCW